MATQQWREETRIGLFDRLAIFTQSLQAGLEMARVPDDDRGQEQSQRGRSLELVCIGAVAAFPLPAQEEVAGPSVKCLPCIEPAPHPPPQLFTPQLLCQVSGFDQAP